MTKELVTVKDKYGKDLLVPKGSKLMEMKDIKAEGIATWEKKLKDAGYKKKP